MATTYNFTNGTVVGAPVATASTLKETEPMILRHIVDFSLQDLEAGEGDIAQVINIPANTTVLTAFVRVITAETANGTIDLGYGGNVDQWGAALDIATAADVVLGHLDAPVFFAAADTIDILATTDSADVDIDGAKLEVIAICVKHLDAY